ncbi:MAG: restriction endonuclease [Armatimonadetes bacterium]|nr:restriction endonuclease [Armatimonadota bacterium]
MKIEQVYSHQNGHEHILVHRSRAWEEIEEVVRDVDAEACRTKVSKEKTMRGRLLFSPTALNRAFAAQFGEREWTSTRTRYWVTADHRVIRRTVKLPPAEQRRAITAAGYTPIETYNQTDFVKDRIAVEVQLGKYSFVAHDLFVKHMAFFIGDIIDVGVEIVPMKAMEAEMSSGVPYYERALHDLMRHGRGTPAVPLVLVGIAP